MDLQAANLGRGFRTMIPPNIFCRLVWAIHHFIFVSQSTNLYSIYTTYIHDKPYHPSIPHPVHVHLQSYKRKTLVRLELANGIIITIFCYTSWQTQRSEIRWKKFHPEREALILSSETEVSERGALASGDTKSLWKRHSEWYSSREFT
jgi:hypothetical protein